MLVNRKSDTRAVFVCILIAISMLILLPTLTNAQKHTAGLIPSLALKVPARVLKGPDSNAIYMRLQSGQFKVKDAPQKYTYRARGEVIVQMDGFLLDDSPGNPVLPYQVYRIALPPEAIPTSLQIEVIHLAEKELVGKYHIAPAPPYILDQEVPTEEQIRWELTKWGVGKEIVDGRNILIYEKDAYYPAQYCQIKSGGQLRKWKVATIIYYPIRYNPVKAQLVLAEQIVLKINFDRDYTYFEQKEAKELLRDDTFDDWARKLFMNYDQAKKWYSQPHNPGSSIYNDSSNESEDLLDPDYVVITTDDIYTNSALLDDFCFHKQDLGFSVMVITEHQTHTVSGTPGSYSFVDAAGGYEDVVGDPPNKRTEKIRQWLIDNYLALGIEYVLLIGNPDPDNMELDDLVGEIPMQLGWTNLISDYPTDLYYSDLSGDWNMDDDNYAGEMYEPAGESNLPVGVNGNLFCARWEGVVEVTGAVGSVYNLLYGYTEGHTKIWFDEDNDGFTDADVILDDTDEHHPFLRYHGVNLANGTYPIRIEYTQVTADAYILFFITNYTTGVTTKFKHDDGAGTYVDNLEADYFNDNDFSAPSDAERFDPIPYVQFIVSGDRDIGGVDFYPEVITGRIPIYDEDEDGNPDYATLDAILTKIIAYENADIHQETWRRRVLISTPHMYDYDDDDIKETADYEGGETLRNYIAPTPFWEWFRIHDEDYGVGAEITNGCTIDRTVEAWNDAVDPDDSRGVVMWRTHGSQTGAEFVFEETRCSDLDDSKPSVVIQTTCQNGHPEVITNGYGIKHYPLGYTLLKQGAIATISSSRNSSGGLFDPADIYIGYKNNPYLLYFLAKGVCNNLDFGDVLAHVKTNDATLGWYWNQIFNYDLFGDPTTSLFGADSKSNNDIVFLLDGSGSMLSEQKWETAVDAAVLFYQLMEELRHAAFQDRYNSVVFRWNESAGVDASTTVPPGTGLKDISTPLTAASLNAETPVPSYYTPIGEGLNLAIDQFDLDTEESFYSNKTILLLSDGKQNRGVDPLSITMPEGSGIKVHAVGLGEDWIEPETIRDIALASEGDYRITPNPREMEDFFIQILCNTSWKLQDITVTGDAAPIDQNKAVFIVIWDDPSVSINFELDPPGTGPNITPSNLTAYPPMVCSYHGPAPDETHAFYVCEDIPAELLDLWYFANINDGGAPIPMADVLLKVIEDPRVTADFNIENIDHYTHQPVVLTAQVVEDGKPMTGLSEVYAELISSPALTPGNLMAENTPPPGYPAQPPDTSDRTLRSHYLFGVMQTLGVDSLSQIGGPRINLHDDGVGVDLNADDGIYSGRFDNTVCEGSYTFKFRVRGENGDGVIFDRIEILSEYIKFAASPTQTKVEIISSVVNQAEKIVTATVKVTPLDSIGSYLGPFRGDVIQLWSNAGFFVKDQHSNLVYDDRKDGSYCYTLVYPKNTVPLVSVSVGEVIVSDRMVVKRPPVRLVSLHGGLAVPLADFATEYDAGLYVLADFEHPLTNILSLRALFGYGYFKAKSPLVDDTHIINLNTNLKFSYHLLPITFFIEVGPGYYILENSVNKPGVNVGGGLWYNLSSKIGLELAVHYHAISTSPRKDYLNLGGGITVGF